MCGEEELAVRLFHQERKPDDISLQFGMQMGEAFIHEDGRMIGFSYKGEHGSERDGLYRPLREPFFIDFGNIPLGDDCTLSVFEIDGICFVGVSVWNPRIFADGIFFGRNDRRSLGNEGDDFLDGIIKQRKKS